MKPLYYILMLGITVVSCKSDFSEVIHHQPTKLYHPPATHPYETPYYRMYIQTPDEALAELKSGNKRFLEGKQIHINYKAQIEHTQSDHDQHPHSFILSCLDARVPPEIVFDQGIGNLFVARVAGNIENVDILGSMEFATEIKGAKLVVVLGHNKCGAVKGAVHNVALGHLTQLVEQIKPAISGDKSYPDPEWVLDATARHNVRRTIRDILETSKIIKGLVDKGKLKVVGAYYNVNSGEVEFLKF